MTIQPNLRWWQRGVVYQIYPRSFRDSNGDGVGDLQGIIDKLDYLNDGTPNSLGIDAIWISPYYKSPMADFGYDIADYCDVDPVFGDLATFDRLVEEAHKRGIKIIVDYVPNHSSDQHSWFIESRSSRNNPKRDWYIWRDPKPGGAYPNNWGGLFGGPAWTWDEKTKQYYFHQFDPAQPDLNWRNPAVKAAMLDVLRFWLKRGVDGFRMDVVYMVWKHPDMPDQPVIEGWAGRGENDIFGRQQQIYAYNYDGIHTVMKEIRAVLDEFDDTVMIGEIWLDTDERMKYHGELTEAGFGDEFHMPFNFDLIGNFSWVDIAVPDAQRIRQIVDSYEAALPPYGWPNYVLGNHDIPRVATRFGGEAQARLAAMLLLTLRGTPTVYMGDELGMVNGAIPGNKIQDPQGLILGAEQSRDQCRTPFEWDASPNAGFSPEGSPEPWLPVAAGYEQRCVAAQINDPHSMLTLFRRLMWTRKQTPALYGGSYRALESPEDTFVYLREADDQKVLVAINFSGAAKAITLPAAGQLVISTHLDREEAVSGELALRPNEGVVIMLA